MKEAKDQKVNEVLDGIYRIGAIINSYYPGFSLVVYEKKGKIDIDDGNFSMTVTVAGNGKLEWGNYFETGWDSDKLARNSAVAHFAEIVKDLNYKYRNDSGINPEIVAFKHRVQNGEFKSRGCAVNCLFAIVLMIFVAVVSTILMVN